MQIRDGPNRSPADMFGFDMLVHGIRGYRLPQQGDLPAEFPHHQLPNLPNGSGLASANDDELPHDELEVFGVDWEGLDDNTVRRSLVEGNSEAGQGTSWIGQQGPPSGLGGFELEGPNAPLFPTQIRALDEHIAPWIGNVDAASVDHLWLQALSYAHTISTHVF